MQYEISEKDTPNKVHRQGGRNQHLAERVTSWGGFSDTQQWHTTCIIQSSACVFLLV